MRVAHVSTWDTECGIARYTQYLKQGLERVGVDGDVVAIDRDRTRYLARRELRHYYSGLAEQLHDSDLIHIQHEFGFFGDDRNYRSMVFEFRRFLKASLQLGKPVFITFHTDPYWYAPPTSDPRTLAIALPAKALWRTAVPPVLNRNSTAHAVVHSGTARKGLINAGVTPKRVTLVPHGVPAPSPVQSDPAVARAARKRLDIPEQATVLGVFGFLSKYKGHMTALRALQHLPRHYQLLFVGGQHPLGSERELESALAYMDEYPELRSRLTVTGHESDDRAREDLAATDMLLAPYEAGTTLSASGALGWALSSGRPVISSKIAPFVELAGDAGCLELVTPDAPHELALAIERLAADPAGRRRLVARAAQYCDMFSWERTAATHARLYAATLDRTAPPPAETRVPAAAAAATSLNGDAEANELLLRRHPRPAPGDRSARPNGAGRPHAELHSVEVEDDLEVTFALDPDSFYDPLATYLAEQGYPQDPPNVIARHLMKNGRTFIDLGAHVGTFSLAIAAAGAHVLSVDASPGNARLLRTAVAYNGLEDRCKIVNAVAGAQSGERLRFTENGSYGFVNPDADVYPELPAHEVPVVAIDDLVAEQGWSHVDVIKIDIEGFEMVAMQGMQELLSRPDAPIVVVECNSDMLGHRGWTTRDLRAAFEDHGYKLHLITRTEDNRLVPVAADDVQPEAAADYVAWKTQPRGLAPWYVDEPLDPDELAERLRNHAHEQSHGYRRYAALAIREAPPEIREHPLNVETLKGLACDGVEEVRKAALGELDPESFGVPAAQALQQA